MSTDVDVTGQCPHRTDCIRCRCSLAAGHPGPHDMHCGQPLDPDISDHATATNPTDQTEEPPLRQGVAAQVGALIEAAGYPMPGGAVEMIRMLLGEIAAAKRLADDCYRSGYRTGRHHGYTAGRIAAACAHCTYPDGASR